MKPTYPENQIGEILRVPPLRLLTYSTISVLVGFVVLVAAGILIKIPEEVTGKVCIYKHNAFVNILSPMDGRIAGLFVEDNKSVDKATALAIIENPVDAREYALLSETVNELRSITQAADTLALVNKNLPDLATLGDLQADYQGMNTALANLKRHCLNPDYQQQMVVRQKALDIHLDYMQRLGKQENLKVEALIFKQKSLDRNRDLHTGQLISDAEWEKLQGEVLDEKMKLEELRREILENDLKMNDCRATILTLRQQYKTTRDELFGKLVAQIEQLHEGLQAWEESYLLRTPTAGKVQFTGLREEHQQITKGQSLMTILPADKVEVSVQMLCAADKGVRVKQSQPVLVELQGYPALIHGYVQARVESIAEVPVDGYYTVNIVLSHGFSTTLEKTLPFGRYTEGYGKIIIHQQTFLGQIVKNIFQGK